MTELVFKGKAFVYSHHLTVPFRPLEMHAEVLVLSCAKAHRAAPDPKKLEAAKRHKGRKTA